MVGKKAAMKGRTTDVLVCAAGYKYVSRPKEGETLPRDFPMNKRHQTMPMFFSIADACFSVADLDLKYLVRMRHRMSDNHILGIMRSSAIIINKL